jgi:hypothetical protein
MGENAKSHLVQSGEGLVTGWDLVRPAPGDQECVRNGVVDRIGGGAATTVGVHVPVVTLVQIAKSGVGCHLQSFSTELTTCICPDMPIHQKISGPSPG